MSINSRQKGCRGEREWAQYLREQGIEARRGRQYAGHPDAPDVVTDLDQWFHAEVKRVESLNVTKAMEKAESDCGEGRVPYVAHRRSRKPWLVTMRACDVVPLMLLKAKGVSDERE